MKFIKYIIATILLYFYFHNPIFNMLGIGSIKLLYPLLLLYIFKDYRKGLFSFKNVFVCYVLLFGFSIFRFILGGDVLYIYKSIIDCIETLFLPISLIILFKNNNIPFIKILIYVGALSTLITILCLVIPTFNLYVKQFLQETEFLKENTFRGFGISDNLVYAYGCILAIIVGIYLRYNYTNKWFMFFIPLIGLSILVNARIGFVIFFFAFFLYLFFNPKFILKTLIGLGVLIILFISQTNFMFEDANTLVFIEQFFLEIKDILLGTNEARGSTVDTLMGDMFVLPSYFEEWIMGTGKNIFLGEQNSDVGFLLQLNYGGIVYIVLLFLLIYNFFVKIKDRYILYFFICATLIANIKGAFIINSGGSRVIFITIIFLVINNYCENKDNKIIN